MKYILILYNYEYKYCSIDFVNKDLYRPVKNKGR